MGQRAPGGRAQCEVTSRAGWARQVVGVVAHLAEAGVLVGQLLWADRDRMKDPLREGALGAAAMAGDRDAMAQARALRAQPWWWQGALLTAKHEALVARVEGDPDGYLHALLRAEALVTPNYEGYRPSPRGFGNQVPYAACS